MILLLLIPPILRVLWDYNGVKAKDYAEHNIWTGVVLLAVATALWRYYHWNYLASLFLTWSTYWLVFDYLYNAAKKKPIFTYYGDFSDKEHLSPLFEKYIYPNLSWKVILYIKVTFFIASITLLILL